MEYAGEQSDAESIVNKGPSPYVLASMKSPVLQPCWSQKEDDKDDNDKDDDDEKIEGKGRDMPGNMASFFRWGAATLF